MVRCIPRLLDFLSPHDWSAVSSTNRQLREWFHNHVHVVSIESPEDLEVLGKGFWPQLTLVLVNDQSRFSIESSFNGRLQLLAAIELHRGMRALLVRPKLQQTSVTASNSAADKHRLSPTALSQLQSHDLESLTILHYKLDPANIAQLATIEWPSLKYLQVEASDLGAVKMGLLLGNWQFDCVTLRGAGCSAMCMHELVQVSSVHLIALDLRDCGIDKLAVAELASGQWPALRMLSLDRNDLCADMLAALAVASFPVLESLILACNSLDAAAAKQLSRGNWPKLNHLTLRDNYLDDEAMLYLSKGQWPNLERLALGQNMMTTKGCEYLMQGPWPKLKYLHLDSRVVGAETWSLLKLKPKYMQQAAELKYCPGSFQVSKLNHLWVPRVMPTVVWPFLQWVIFDAVDLRSTPIRRELTKQPFSY